MELSGKFGQFVTQVEAARGGSMDIDGILGRFRWYRRYRGGVWCQVPGMPGQMMRQGGSREGERSSLRSSTRGLLLYTTEQRLRATSTDADNRDKDDHRNPPARPMGHAHI